MKGRCMDKIDFKKQFWTFYAPSKNAPAIADVPPFKFLMIDGEENR